MRYLLSILTILAIIGSVWYNKGLTGKHYASVDKLNTKLEELQVTTEPKIARMNKRLDELFTAVDQENVDYQNKLAVIEARLDAAQRQQEGKARRALAHRALSAQEWKATLETFGARRVEIAQLLTKSRRQISDNNQKLAAIIKQDTEDMARREDSMRSSARSSLSSGRAGGRATSYALIEAREAMEKKHRNMTKAVGLQNGKLMESIQKMEDELVQMDRAEEDFMKSNSPHNKNYDPSGSKITPIKPAHPDILNLQNQHKTALVKLQRDIDAIQDAKLASHKKLERERKEINKQKMELQNTYQENLRTAQFTGYGAIGILAVLTLISFSFTNRYD